MKNDILERLASVQLTLVCLVLAMVLLLQGTLAQAHIGTFAAQKEFFNSAWIYAHLGSWRIPVFPGGLCVGALWIINLLAAFAVRFQYHKGDAGILMSHVGLVVLLLGQFLTQTLARETQMPIELGETSRYSQSFKEMELAIIMTSAPETDQVTSIPYALLSREDRLDPPGLPFSLFIRKIYPNAQLMRTSRPGLATQGVGTRIDVEALSVTSQDDEVNAPAAFVEIQESGRSIGTWLLSPELGAPQSFQVQSKEYQLSLRPRRRYLPFSLTLKEFHHDLYPGTDIPKNFSSLVHLENPAKQESRDALIYMNHPLRYEGMTFYQSSFGKNDRLSVFQVVENPAFWTPYVGCLLVALGLVIEFLSHLFEFLRKRP